MKSHLERIARLETVRGVKQQRVDVEAQVLAAIRHEKGKVEMQLASWQQKYVEGVTSLNQERESSSRAMLFALEAAVDHARETLFELFQALREMDSREQAQMMQLDVVQRELEAVKTLQETRRQDFNRELARQEQKQLDEMGLRRFMQAR